MMLSSGPALLLTDKRIVCFHQPVLFDHLTEPNLGPMNQRRLSALRDFAVY
jgi:hypothetical protein